MKYVKLFENWLNEAEGGAVKPFDPDKPANTLVVDITNENLAKADENNQAEILKGILCKSAHNIDASDESYQSKKGYTIIPYTFKSKENNTIELRNNNQEKYSKVDLYAGVESSFAGWNKMTTFNKKVCFLVYTEGDKPFFGENEFVIKRSGNYSRLLIFPVGGDDPKDFLLNSKWLVHLHNPDAITKETSFYETTLGCIAAWANVQFKYTSVDTLNDKNAGTPQNIAKLLGYEIPENYAPGQGVEKKKA